MNINMDIGDDDCVLMDIQFQIELIKIDDAFPRDGKIFLGKEGFDL